ncbi:hypothetical protein [Aquabacter spiritensis]|uniref:Uncharacterized protein n=1 Tax=Aquabacter spiritensis TaxID=933073 RepID=A0A4R3LSJ2_9HYPH|nr:hypothetical protein [Aquabacter spiritensis]TCT03523.1 hypothetical protein EDC64_10973 [Aquabacter spiritensis]
MNTGLTSLAKITEITVIYPFSGMEYLYSAVAGAFFVFFIARQIMMEKEVHEELLDHTSEALPAPAE